MKINIKIIVFFILTLLSSPVPVRAQNIEEGIKVTAVQLEVSPSLYSSEDHFYNSMDRLMGKIVEKHKPDLVIFPEYTGVFLALVPYHNLIDGFSDISKALSRIQKIYPQIGSINELFSLQADVTGRIMDRIWGRLANKYGITIVAGSYFALTYEALDDTEKPHVELRNRAVVYGLTGERIYSQDKVFLTEFEQNVLALSSGEIGSAAGFNVKGRRVVISICRDTFMEEWEERFEGADLWIDIKANGTEYTEEERRRFLTALPERIANSEVPYGVTVCLTGRYLDLFWEGESSFIEKEDESYRVLKATESYRSLEIVAQLLTFDDIY